MLVKKLTNNNRKMTALAALGAVSAIGATTQVASADQTAAEQQAQSRLSVAIGRALEAKTSSEYRGVISNYKTAFDTALAHAESLTTSTDVNAVNEAAINLSNAIYDVNDPQNQQISSGAIVEVSTLANKLRQYQAYPDYDEFEDSVKNEINQAIEDAMNLAQNPSQGEYNRVKAEIKQAGIDADMQINLIIKKHNNSSASSSSASSANSKASSNTSNTSSAVSSNASSASSNTSSNTSNASNTSSNTSSASSNTSNTSSASSNASNASSASSNTNSDANKSSDVNAALNSVASNAANAFSSAIASIVSSTASNSQTSSNSAQSNASSDDQEISNDENTGTDKNTPKNSLQNAITELERIKNSDTYKSLSPEEQKEIDQAIENGKALLNKQGVSDDELTKMAENLNTVSIKYMSTKWVDADGNELLKPEKGYHPDVDGKSDVSGYVFDHRALDKDGNMVNYYRKENQSENKTYYYDDHGHLIRNTIGGAHVDKGQSTISGYKLLGSYTLTDKDVSKGGDFYGIGMKAGDVINLYKKDTSTNNNASSAASNAASSAVSSDAGKSSVSDSNASDGVNIASDADNNEDADSNDDVDSNGHASSDTDSTTTASSDTDSTTTDPGQEQPISETGAVDVESLSNNDNDSDGNGSADTNDDNADDNGSSDTNGTDDNLAPETATNEDAATPADSGNADAKNQDGKTDKTAQTNGQTPARTGQTATTNGSGSSAGTLPQTGSDDKLSALLTAIGMLTATTGTVYMGVKKRKKA